MSKNRGTQVIKCIVFEASQGPTTLNGGSVPGHISTKPSCDRLALRVGPGNEASDRLG